MSQVFNRTLFLDILGYITLPPLVVNHILLNIIKYPNTSIMTNNRIMIFFLTFFSGVFLIWTKCDKYLSILIIIIVMTDTHHSNAFCCADELHATCYKSLDIWITVHHLYDFYRTKVRPVMDELSVKKRYVVTAVFVIRVIVSLFLFALIISWHRKPHI